MAPVSSGSLVKTAALSRPPKPGLQLPLLRPLAGQEQPLAGLKLEMVVLEIFADTHFPFFLPGWIARTGE